MKVVDTIILRNDTGKATDINFTVEKEDDFDEVLVSLADAQESLQILKKQGIVDRSVLFSDAMTSDFYKQLIYDTYVERLLASVSIELNDIMKEINPEEEIFSANVPGFSRLFNGVASRLLVTLFIMMAFVTMAKNLNGQTIQLNSNTHMLCDALFYVYSIPQEVTYKIAMHETGHGQSRICCELNNWFGIGGDDNPEEFIMKDESFWRFGKIISEHYSECIDADWRVMIDCIGMKGYAEDKDWSSKVKRVSVPDRIFN